MGRCASAQDASMSLRMNFLVSPTGFRAGRLFYATRRARRLRSGWRDAAPRLANRQRCSERNTDPQSPQLNHPNHAPERERHCQLSESLL